MTGTRRTATVLGLLLAAGIGSCKRHAVDVDDKGGPGTPEVRVAFEDTEVGSLPPGWQVGETNGRGTPATWRVAEGAGPAGGARVLRLAETTNSGSTFNVVLLPERFPADLALTVNLRADSGQEDRGGGLLWRAADADNYYITRWNPLENNLRAYKVVGGRRSMLASANVEADPREWHKLEVEAVGRRIRVRLDGKELLSLEDATFTRDGLVGLWTKADAATTFDDLRARALGQK